MFYIIQNIYSKFLCCNRLRGKRNQEPPNLHPGELSSLLPHPAPSPSLPAWQEAPSSAGEGGALTAQAAVLSSSPLGQPCLSAWGGLATVEETERLRPAPPTGWVETRSRHAPRPLFQTRGLYQFLTVFEYEAQKQWLGRGLEPAPWSPTPTRPGWPSLAPPQLSPVSILTPHSGFQPAPRRPGALQSWGGWVGAGLKYCKEGRGPPLITQAHAQTCTRMSLAGWRGSCWGSLL